MNVLFIAVDDLRPELGCYGNAMVKTPNIDRLAARGVRFDRAYCQFPLCNPSRTSLLTGRYPTTTTVMDNQKYFRDVLPDVVSLPEHFRAHGYVTARTGKIFHGGIDDDKSWDEGFEPRRPPAPRTPQQYRQQSDRWVAAESEENQPDYRTATRVPLLIAAPNAPDNGKASPRTAEFVDLYPTLVELCGLPMPKGLEGQSLAPLLKNPNATWAHPAYTFARRGNIFGRTVRTERYRYTEWDDEGKKAELYDHQTDPHEMRNLANDPQHAKTLEEMRRLLRAVK